MSLTPPDRIVAPTREDGVAAAASEVIGGPLGRYAVPVAKGWRHTAAMLAAASAIPSGLGIVLRAPCIDQGWSTPDQFWHACFSDLPAAYRDAGLESGVGAFLAGGFGAPHPTQPPLTGFVMSLLASAVPSGPIEDRMRLYFSLWAVLGAILLALTTWWTAATVRRFPLRAAHVALSPVVVVALVVSPDVLGVALTAAALHLWSRQRLVGCGVVLGLAISARSYPVVVLVALLFLALRSGRVSAWARTAGAAVATFAVVLLGFGVLNPDAAVAAYRAWVEAGAGFGSPWLLPQLAGHPLVTGAVTILTVVGWVVAVLAGGLLALASPRRPGVAEVSLVMLGIVMLTGRSMPVQSALWLVPLVALVGLRWRDHLAWASVEGLHFLAVWLYLAGASVPDRGLPAGWYATFLVLRLAGVLWLVVATWRAASGRRPVLGEVEALDEDEEADELAGAFAAAPDRLIVSFR